MGLINKLFGDRAEPPPTEPPASRSGNSTVSGDWVSGSPDNRMRRDTLRLVLRQTLQANGIPNAWIVAETLPVPPRGRAIGVHLRLVLQHWDARFVACAPAFQHDFLLRLLDLDPDARSWMFGFSWQFPPSNDAGPMPDPASW